MISVLKSFIPSDMSCLMKNLFLSNHLHPLLFHSPRLLILPLLLCLISMTGYRIFSILIPPMTFHIGPIPHIDTPTPSFTAPLSPDPSLSFAQPVPPLEFTISTVPTVPSSLLIVPTSNTHSIQTRSKSGLLSLNSVMHLFLTVPTLSLPHIKLHPSILNVAQLWAQSFKP